MRMRERLLRRAALSSCVILAKTQSKAEFDSLRVICVHFELSIAEQDQRDVR